MAGRGAPNGMTHHDAPLGIMVFSAGGQFDFLFNCVMTF